MLSVLIPVYNYPITSLVQTLHQQCTTSGVAFEILCCEDGSTQHLKENASLASLPGVKYTVLNENKGRSAIRNHLASQSAFDLLLFLDCDVSIHHSDFVERYLHHSQDVPVVNGGLSYTPIAPKDSNRMLRWHYGTQREAVSASQRNSIPYQSFMTSNLLMWKETFHNIRLDESIKGYGHEDTLFGAHLKANNIAIKHINNPVQHDGIDTSEEFLRKTLIGVRNLSKLRRSGQITQGVRLLETYTSLSSWGGHYLMYLILKPFEGALKRNILGARPKLLLFDLYKLMYLIQYMR